MKKIPTLFERNHDGDKRVRDEATPGCEWVLAGEGVATRKYDGTCCMVRDGRLYKRQEIRPTRTEDAWDFVLPPDFILEEKDLLAGKAFGWTPVGDGPGDRWHREASREFRRDEKNLDDKNLLLRDGTYELLGPKIQGNPEGIPFHMLQSHEHAQRLPDCPRDFEGLKKYLGEHDIEGVVWHHPDGRMCKIKGRDFGIKRGRKKP